MNKTTKKTTPDIDMILGARLEALLLAASANPNAAALQIIDRAHFYTEFLLSGTVPIPSKKSPVVSLRKAK